MVALLPPYFTESNCGLNLLNMMRGWDLSQCHLSLAADYFNNTTLIQIFKDILQITAMFMMSGYVLHQVVLVYM